MNRNSDLTPENIVSQEAALQEDQDSESLRSPERSPCAADLSNEQGDYAHLLALTGIATRSKTSAQGMEEVYHYLHLHFRCIGMVLETQEGVGVRRHTCGDAEATDLTALSHPHPVLYTHLVFPMITTPGHVTFVFGVQDAPTHSLLQVAAQWMGMCVANERMQQRADRAEASTQRRIREVAALYEIGHTPSLQSIQPMLQLIVDRTALLMEAQACSILLFDAQQQCLQLAASHGLSPRPGLNLQLMGEGIAGRVAQFGQPLLISRATRHDPRLQGVSLRPDIGSAMLVPMKNQDGPILGVLSIRRSPGHAEFTEEDVKLFSVFASQAALSLVNARLLEDLNQRAGELSKLSSLSRALLSTTDLDALLQTVTEDICSIGGFERRCLYLRDAHRSLFTARIRHGYPENLARNPVKEGEGAIGRIARSKELLHFDSQESVAEEIAATAAYRQWKGFARSLGSPAFVVVPILTSKNTCIALLVADNQRKTLNLTKEQKNLLHAFVSQAGIALENALLYEQMQESVAKLRRLTDYTDNVLQSIEAAIITTDTRGQVVRCNRAAERLLQAPARQLRLGTLEQAVANLHLPHEEQEPLLQAVTRVQETGERIHRLKWTLHPQNSPATTFYLMVSRLPERAHAAGEKGERAGVVIIFEDVTQEMRLEAELEKMRRLADIGQLAAKMAHEVRNALSPIKGAAQLMRSETANPEWPDMIIAEVDGLSRLTSEMLNFARPTPLAAGPVEINALLQSSLQSLSAFLAENHTCLRWQLRAGLPPLMADVVQIGQVIRNLVMNAAQSMPEGGTLTLQSDWDAQTQRVGMRFIDTGVGIAQEDHERIFRPFVTTRPKGTGLGLPIVQKNVDNHGGTVHVDSEPGKGTTFVVWLPLVPPADGENPERPTISPGTAGTFPDN